MKKLEYVSYSRRTRWGNSPGKKFATLFGNKIFGYATGYFFLLKTTFKLWFKGYPTIQFSLLFLNFIGIAYKVPDEEVARTIEYLNFRERAGYTVNISVDSV